MIWWQFVGIRHAMRFELTRQRFISLGASIYHWHVNPVYLFCLRRACCAGLENVQCDKPWFKNRRVEKEQLWKNTTPWDTGANVSQMTNQSIGRLIDHLHQVVIGIWWRLKVTPRNRLWNCERFFFVVYRAEQKRMRRKQAWKNKIHAIQTIVGKSHFEFLLPFVGTVSYIKEMWTTLSVTVLCCRS